MSAHHELRECSPQAREKRLVIWTDGASRGNPGPAAAGFVVKGARGRRLRAAGKLLGRATNNEAEYRALVLALQEARGRGARNVEIRTDSELLARHLDGLYKVKAGNLKPLYREAMGLLAGFESWSVRAIPREKNKEADGLANKALDAGRDIG